MISRPSFLRLLLLLLVAAPLSASPAQAREASRDFMTTSFTEVAIDGAIAVKVTTNANPSVVAYGDPDMIDRLVVRKIGDKLRISLSRTGTQVDPARRVPGKLRVEIASWAIETLAINGPADVTADALSGQTVELSLAGAARLSLGKVASDTFDLSMSGNGSLAIAGGKANEVEVRLNGAPSLDAAKFVAARLDLSLIGPASATIGARDNAAISAQGAGKVEIVGRPVCKISSAGMAAIACGNAR